MKMYIVVVVYDATFDDEIIDDEIEIKLEKTKSKRTLKISLIEIWINCIKIKFEMFAKIMKNNELLWKSFILKNKDSLLNVTNVIEMQSVKLFNEKNLRFSN